MLPETHCSSGVGILSSSGIGILSEIVILSGAKDLMLTTMRSFAPLL